MVTDFIFDKVMLSDLGYILVLESEEYKDIHQMDYGTIKGSRTDVSHKTSYNYGQNYSTTFTIMKNSCSYGVDELDLTYNDIRELTRWLCRKEYKWFKFCKDDEDDEIWYEVKINTQKEYVGEKIVGLKLFVEANSPYGFSKEMEKTYIGTNFRVKIYSDEEGYIYPDVKIKLTNGGNLVLTNVFENRQTTLKNCVGNEIITFHGGDIQQIESTKSHDFITEFNYQFPRFVNEYGSFENTFTSNLPCTISFTYREIRKVGME